MKITIVMANPNMSGGDRVCAIYAKKLLAKGHSVNVIAPKKNLLTLKQQLKRIVIGQGWLTVAEQMQNHFDLLGVNVNYLDSPTPNMGDNLPDADVVIATFWLTAEWVSKFSDSKGIKIYFIQHHEIHPWHPVERVKQTYLLPFYKITISNWLLYLMQNTYQSSVLSKVPNSVDTALFFTPARVKQDNPTLGFMYSSIGFKGIDIAFKVIEKVKNAYPNLRVLCFGSKKPDKNAALPSYFEFEYNPEQEKIRDIYGQCDVWLCCSRSEGFHLPPLEAMACRCPVVSTKVGGPEDIIQQNQNGLLCDIDDVDSLTDAVSSVLNLPEQDWLALSDAALKTATQYTWNDATELFEQALNQAIENGVKH